MERLLHRGHINGQSTIITMIGPIQKVIPSSAVQDGDETPLCAVDQPLPKGKSDTVASARTARRKSAWSIVSTACETSAAKDERTMRFRRPEWKKIGTARAGPSRIFWSAIKMTPRCWMRDTPKRRSPPHPALTSQPIELTTNVANPLLLLVGQLQGLRATGITARRLHLWP